MKYRVDIEGGNAFVERLKEKAPAIGGFGGMFKVPRILREPLSFLQIHLEQELYF